MYFSYLVIAVSCLAVSEGQICSQPTSKPTFPNDILPELTMKSFSMDVEKYVKGGYHIIAGRITYDSNRGIIRLSMKSNTVATDMYFYFADNEILTFHYKGTDTSCTTKTDLASDPMTFLVGGVVKNAAGKNAPAPFLSLLHFTGKDANGVDVWPAYIPPGENMTMIRGKEVHWFQSCQTWTDISGVNLLAQVDHYFSTSEWNYPLQKMVPVKTRIQGTQGGLDVDDTYSFFNIKTTIDQSSLETPPGIFCPGRKVDKPFPTFPSYIKWSREVIDVIGQDVYYYEEIYDRLDNFSLVKSQTRFNSLGDMNRLIEFSNFEDGLYYKIDQKSKSCEVRNISNVAPEYTTKNDGTVNMVSTNSFFEMTNATFAYLGQRSIRGLQADIWVADSYDANFFRNLTIEWYFAPPEINDWNSYIPKGFRIPIKTRVWTRDEMLYEEIPSAGSFPMSYRKLSTDTNIYHVDLNDILFNAISIRSCSPNTPSNYFDIVFKDSITDLKGVNIERFKWQVLLKISAIADVNWSRVTDFKVYMKGNDIAITFEIMDLPPFAGDIDNPPKQSNLQEATKSIQDAVNNGQFHVDVNPMGDVLSKKETKRIYADRSVSIRPQKLGTSQGSSGYSSGSMAGLGIPMLLIGLLVGGGGSYYLIFKRRTFG